MRYVVARLGRTTARTICQDEDEQSVVNGFVVDGWNVVETGEEHEVVDEAEPMKYSTLSIKRELAKIGKWDTAKELLTASGYWDDYVLANYLSETDQVFKTACAALVACGIVTDAELDKLLPKCVWTAE